MMKKEIDMVPRTMRAVRQMEAGGKLVIETVPVPQPGPGEVLIRMAASPINPSDLASLKGGYLSHHHPFTPGLEGSGTVVSAGKGLLPRLRIGKRVACSPNPEEDGTWAEYMKTSVLKTVPLPSSVSMEQGSMMLVNPMTAMAFMQMAKGGKHKAMVNNAAASALGKMLIRLAILQDIPLINIVRKASQVEALKAMGATYVLNSSDSSFESELQQLSTRLGATLFLDAVTGEQTALLLKAAPRGSTIVAYARLSGDPIAADPGELMVENKRITGFQLGSWLQTKSTPFKLSFINQVKSRLGNELTSTIHQISSMEKVEEAIQSYKTHMSDGKIVLNLRSESE